MITLVGILTALLLIAAVLSLVIYRKYARFAPIFIFAAFVVSSLGALFLWNVSEVPSALINRPVPEFSLTSLDGKTNYNQSLLTDGKVRLVNVWASWCAPCRAEHPILMKLKNQGIDIVGLNYKDKSDNAAAFLNNLGDPFSVSLADPSGRTGIDFGVYGVPETFIIDRNGRIAYKHIGPILEMQLTDFMEELEKVKNTPRD
jgi:periplasmic protein thiol:disulfide oxidoreductases, DsbE subfamily